MSGNESTNRTVQAEGIKSLVEEVVKCQHENNVPVYVGEFNIFDFYDLWSDLLNSLKRENISVCVLFKILLLFGLVRCFLLIDRQSYKKELCDQFKHQILQAEIQRVIFSAKNFLQTKKAMHHFVLFLLITK